MSGRRDRPRPGSASRYGRPDFERAVDGPDRRGPATREEAYSGNDGFSLIEVLCCLLLLGILVASAALPLKHWLDGMRVRSALNRVTAEVYRARSLAVQSGAGSTMRLGAGAGGCVRSLRVASLDRPESTVGAELDLTGLCLRHSGDSILIFNSRGMLRPPTRSFYATYGTDSDSLLLSIAGRTRRNY